MKDVSYIAFGIFIFISWLCISWFVLTPWRKDDELFYKSSWLKRAERPVAYWLAWSLYLVMWFAMTWFLWLMVGSRWPQS